MVDIEKYPLVDPSTNSIARQEIDHSCYSGLITREEEILPNLHLPELKNSHPCRGC